MVLTGCGQSIPDIPDLEVYEQHPALTRDRVGKLRYEGNLFSGYLVDYYSGGALKSKSAYSDGLQESVSYGYYPSGEIMYLRPYIEGEKQGIHIGYYPDGRKKFVYRFEAGLSIGNHREWYADGQLTRDLNYVNGQPFGPQKMWRSDGKIRSNYVIREDGRRYGLVGIKRCKNIDTEKERITRLTSAIYDK